VIVRRCTDHGLGLGRVRWVVKRTFAWLHNRRTRGSGPLSRVSAHCRDMVDIARTVEGIRPRRVSLTSCSRKLAEPANGTPA
jgi:hypothetical protein